MEEKPFNPTNLHKDTMEARLLKKGVCVCVCVCVCGNDAHDQFSINGSLPFSVISEEGANSCA